MAVRIAAMLRCRNEARWLGEVLRSIQPLTPDILVFNDHSTDETASVAISCGAAVLPSPFPHDAHDEVRDKNYLLNITRRVLQPEYVLCIDGDEVLSAGSANRITAALEPGIGVLSFPIRYLWNDRLHYRADGVYSRYARASMFSLLNTGPVQFKSTRYGCNFHCGNVPAGLKGIGSTVMGADLLHLGYMHAEDRIRKYEWYNAKDPNNQDEDGYRHMVIGDIFPAESRFRHGGPLKIYSLPASKWAAVISG